LKNRKIVITIIIRASGEATVRNLWKQLKIQKDKEDVLRILDSEISFEEKIKEGYLLGLTLDNPFTLFIDGDILVRSNFIKKVKALIPLLQENELGFGLKLLDRFYGRPKFRGIHLYKTSFLKKALELIPFEGKKIRPESFIKDEMSKIGYKWNNEISDYIAGIHDFYQYPRDIYYKFVIRSKRSPDDIGILKKRFLKEKNSYDFQIALRGLIDGESKNKISNDKFNFDIPKELKFLPKSLVNKKSFEIDLIIFINRIKSFYKSLMKTE